MHLFKFEHPLKIRMASDRSKVHEGQAVQLLLISKSIWKFYIPWFLQCMRPPFATAWTLSCNAHLAWYLREGFINVTFLGQIKAFWQKLFQTVADFFSHSTEMCSVYCNVDRSHFTDFHKNLRNRSTMKRCHAIFVHFAILANYQSKAGNAPLGNNPVWFIIVPKLAWSAFAENRRLTLAARQEDIKG